MQVIPNLRLDYVDAEWARGVLAVFEQDRADILDDAEASPRQLSQIEYVMLAEDCQAIGMLKYGLGYPLSETRAAFAEAAKANLRVFELRGTQAAFEVTVAGGEEAKPLREPGATDDSLTNSRRGLYSMYVALIAGNATIAREIAVHVWDPPNATYIGPESEVCTLDDQQLAYAVKALLMGKKKEALSYLRIRRSTSSSAQVQAELIETLITNRKPEFIAQLNDLLDWHRQQSASVENRKNIDLFFSIPGLALCSLALGCGLAQRSELPEHEVFLPLNFLNDDAVDMP